MKKMSTEGTVVGTVTEHRKLGFLEFQFMPKMDCNNGEGDNHWYKPVITYKVEGKVYQYVSRAAYRGYKELDLGEKVQLYYNADNPNKCRIVNK